VFSYQSKFKLSTILLLQV